MDIKSNLFWPKTPFIFFCSIQLLVSHNTSTFSWCCIMSVSATSFCCMFMKHVGSILDKIMYQIYTSYESCNNVRSNENKAPYDELQPYIGEKESEWERERGREREREREREKSDMKYIMKWTNDIWKYLDWRIHYVNGTLQGYLLLMIG